MKSLIKKFVLFTSLAALFSWGGYAYAAACISQATGNWNAQTTWGTAGTGCAGAVGGIPGAADTVTIASPNTVTANVAVTVGAVTINTGGTLAIAGSNWTVNGTTNVSGTLSHTNTGGSETYIGLVTINAGGVWDNAIGESIVFQGGLIHNGASFTSGTLAANGRMTFNTNNQAIGGASAINFVRARIQGAITVTNNNTNIVTIIGTLDGTVAGSTWVNGANATVNYSSATVPMSTNGVLTASAAGNTFNYSGAAQTLDVPTGAPATYYHLTLSGSGVKTMPATAMTVAGNFTMSGTATTTAAQALTVGGNFTIGATNTFAAGVFTHSVGGNWSNSGTFTASTSSVTFNGTAAQTIGGIASTTFNNLAVSNTGAGNTTLLINTSVAGNLSVNSGTLFLSTFSANRTAAGGTITVANGATLDIGGTNTFPTNYTTHTIGATSTIVYSGANQSVAAESAPGYGNLTLNGSGTKTAAGSFIVRSDLVIGSGVTLASAAFIQTVNGNVTNNGTQTATTGSITLSGGTITHTLSGNGSYANLILNDALGATLAGSPTVSSVLTLTSGIITTGANTLEVTSSCVAPSIVGASATRFVLGNLTLHYPAGTNSCIFPIGDATAYTPATVTIATVTSTLANSALTASTTAGDHPDTTAGISGIDAAKSVNRSWSLTPGAGLTFATYDTTFNFVAGDVDVGASTANFIIGRKNGGVWSYPTVGAKNGTSTQATGMTQAGGFGVYVIGERWFPSFTVIKSVAVFSDPVNGTTNQKFIPGAIAQYTIMVTNFGGVPDNNSVVVSDPVPANMSMCVSTVCSNPPVAFSCSTTPPCGLTYNYASNVTYSSAPGGGAPFTYTPVPDANGYDAAVTGMSINPQGIMNAAVGGNPNFSLLLKMQIK